MSNRPAVVLVSELLQAVEEILTPTAEQMADLVDRAYSLRCWCPGCYPSIQSAVGVTEDELPF